MAACPKLNIAIVGSGLAGLTTASILREQHNVTIFERGDRHAATGGQGIMIAPNGGSILDRLGWDRDLAGGVPIHGIRLYDKGGTVLKEEASLALRERFGSDYTALKRSQFRDELLRLATMQSTELGLPGNPVKIMFNSPVTELNAKTGTLTLLDGQELSFDVVVVADGIHSRLRKFVLGNDNHTARKSGLTCYRVAVAKEDVLASLGVVKAPHWWDEATARNQSSVIYAGDDSHRVVIAYPIASEEMFNLSCIIKTPGSKQGATESWYADADKMAMIDLFKDIDTGLHRVLLAAKEVKVWELQDIEPLPTWTCGRAMIIGDAAHAMTPMQGQGANMCIEDAESLSLLLGPDATSERVPAILRLAESVRKPRVTQVLEATRRVHTTKGVMENAVANIEFNCSYGGVRQALAELRDVQESSLVAL